MQQHTATTVQQPQTIQPTTTEFDVVTGNGSESQTVMPFRFDLFLKLILND